MGSTSRGPTRPAALAVAVMASRSVAQQPEAARHFEYAPVEILRPVHVAAPALTGPPDAARPLTHIHYAERPVEYGAPPGATMLALVPATTCSSELPDAGPPAHVAREGTTATISVPDARSGTAYTVELETDPPGDLLSPSTVVVVGREAVAVRLRTPETELRARIVRAEPVILAEVRP